MYVVTGAIRIYFWVKGKAGRGAIIHVVCPAKDSRPSSSKKEKKKKSSRRRAGVN